MIYISIIVENGKIIIRDCIPLILDLFIEKEFSIDLSKKDQNDISVIPLHVGNIEAIRIQYNDVQDLFTINVSTESEFVINLKATIYSFKLVPFETMTFLDIFCKDRWIIENKIRIFDSKEDEEGLFSYLRDLVGNEIIDNYRKKKA